MKAPTYTPSRAPTDETSAQIFADMARALAIAISEIEGFVPSPSDMEHLTRAIADHSVVVNRLTIDLTKDLGGTSAAATIVGMGTLHCALLNLGIRSARRHETAEQRTPIVEAVRRALNVPSDLINVPGRLQ